MRTAPNRPIVPASRCGSSLTAPYKPAATFTAPYPESLPSLILWERRLAAGCLPDKSLEGSRTSDRLRLEDAASRRGRRPTVVGLRRAKPVCEDYGRSRTLDGPANRQQWVLSAGVRQVRGGHGNDQYPLVPARSTPPRHCCFWTPACRHRDALPMSTPKRRTSGTGGRQGIGYGVQKTLSATPLSSAVPSVPPASRAGTSGACC